MGRTPDFRKNKTLSDVVNEGRRPQKIPETGWYRVAITENFEGSGFIGGTEAVFQNAWENLGGATNAPASWYLSEDGEVRLRGKITGGEDATLVFTLPEECRPEFCETFICATDNGGKANVTIWPDGRVIVDSTGA